MCREKFSETLVARFQQNRQVATVDHMARRLQAFRPFDEIAKIGNHFRRAAGEIDSCNIDLRQPINDSVDCLAGHDFLAFRSSVHMTMHASQVAKLAHVHLKNFRASAAELQTFGEKPIGEAIHF